MARTVMSWSQRIWQLSRTPVRPRAARTFFSAAVIWSGSPATNSTRQVVQRALPPQACSWSILGLVLQGQHQALAGGHVELADAFDGQLRHESFPSGADMGLGYGRRRGSGQCGA